MRLALDTAFSACSVALDDKGKILASKTLNQRRGQAETLVPLVDELLKAAGAAPKDIDEIVLSIGPGTFAGVRIATAFARTLALTNKAKILGLTSFEALAGTLYLEGKATADDQVLALVPGKRGEISGELFMLEEGEPRSLKVPETMALDKLGGFVDGQALIVSGPDLEGNLKEAQNLIPKATFDFWPTAKQLLALAATLPGKRFQATVSPFYLRPPDATPQSKPRF
jgi:tRNA threonylcarbamoyladenosine biosynthesis protein TsaB